MRLLKKIVLISFASLLGLFTILSGILHFCEDDIEQLALDHINQQLKVPIQINQIELRVWKNFPFATLELEDVYIPSIVKEIHDGDTLFFAKSMRVEFDIVDLINGTYEIEKIQASSGLINLKMDDEGDNNFDISKPSEEKSQDDEIVYKLDHIGLTNFRFKYKNDRSNQDYQAIIKQGKVNGTLYENDFDLKGSLALFINKFQNKNVNLISRKNVNLNTTLKVNLGDKNKYQFDNAQLKVEDMKFLASGSVMEDSLTYCDIQVKGDQIDLKSFFGSFSNVVGSEIQQYKSQGIVDFNAGLKGYVEQVGGLDVNAQFAFENGSLTEPNSGIKLSEASLSGSYTNRNEEGKDYLEIKNLKALMPDGNIEASFTMTDFEDPLIDGRLKGQVDLKTLQEFLNLSSVDRIKGQLFVDSQLKARITAPNDFKTRNIKIYKSTGLWRAQNVELQMRDTDLKITDLNGAIVLSGNDAAIQELRAKVGESDLSFDGGFKDIIPYILFDNHTLKMVANVDAKQIRLEDFVGSAEDNVYQTASRTNELSIPDDLDLNFRLDIAKLTYGTFLAEDIAAKMIMLDQVIHLKDVNLKSADGALSGRLRLDGTKSEYHLTTKLSIRDMNVTKVFQEFENFGQTTLLDENIKGVLTSNVELDAHLNSDLDFINESINARADINLKNGELINLASLIEVTDYLKENKLANTMFKKHIIAMENRLKHVKFNTMTNQITVQNQRVLIPKMEIQSTALDMHMAGLHTFEDSIDYSLDFRFNDLKATKENEFGNEIDDGTGIRLFLRMHGTVEDPIFELDKKSRKEQTKARIEEEKNQTRAVLQENLGLFKKDTTLSVRRKKEAEIEFLLYEGELEEENSELKPKEKKRKEPRSNKNRASKLFDKLLLDKKAKEEEPIEIEIDG